MFLWIKMFRLNFRVVFLRSVELKKDWYQMIAVNLGKQNALKFPLFGRGVFRMINVFSMTACWKWLA